MSACWAGGNFGILVAFLLGSFKVSPTFSFREIWKCMQNMFFPGVGGFGCGDWDDLADLGDDDEDDDEEGEENEDEEE